MLHQSYLRPYSTHPLKSSQFYYFNPSFNDEEKYTMCFLELNFGNLWFHGEDTSEIS